MTKKVYITGIGVISAIGNKVSENYESLLAKKSGIGEITFLDTVHKGKIPVAEVKLSDKELKYRLGFSGDDAVTRTALLGITAAKEALKNASVHNMKKYRTGIVSATTVAGMVAREKYYLDFLNSDFLNEHVNTFEAADSTERIADFFGIKEFMTTVSTACSSSANAIMTGVRLIKSGLLDRVIAGGTDALSKYTLNGFNTLMILDREHCKPYDNERKGLNLGEAAAYLILESEKTVKEEGKIPLAVVSGYANANDAFHQTASSPEGYGAYSAMMQALKTANLKPQDINYVNVHGTGTPNNDLSEGRAMIKAFNGKVPKFSSTKAYTGHTLAAAGSLEAAFSVLSLQKKVIFPNLNFQNPMHEFDLIPQVEVSKNTYIEHIMSNSFGFGGNGTVLIFSEIKQP